MEADADAGAVRAPDGKPSPEQAEVVARAFLRVFDRYPQPGGFVADESELPFPKARIDEALLVRLKLAPGEDSRRRLGAAYLGLADWQPKVGRTISKGQLSAATNDSLSTFEIQQVAAQFRELLKWERIVAAERSSRADNLKALGLA